jgi:tetratricopeptide (TPR) repeat protein
LDQDRPKAFAAWPILVGCLVLLHAGCACLRFSGQQPQLCAEAGRLTRQARSALASGSHQLAQRLLNRSLQCCPDDPQALAMLAEADLVDGDPARAIKTLSRLARNSPDRADLRVRLGRACLASGEIELARTEAAAATMLAPDDVAAWQLLGEVAEAAGDDSGALDSYLRAVAIDGSDAGLSLRIAGLHQRGGDPARALSAVSHYLDRVPAGSPPYDGLLKEGELLMELGQTARAVERLALATRHPSAGAESFVRLSQAQTRAGLPVQARQTLVTAIERWPDEVELDALLARMEAGPPPGALASHSP